MHNVSFVYIDLWKLSCPSWINPYHNLETRINNIARVKFEGCLSKQQMKDLKQGYKLAHSWIWPASRMKELLSTLPPDTVKAFMLELLEGSNEKEIEYYFQLCLSFFNEVALLDLSGCKSIDVAAASFKADCLTRSTALRSSLEREGQTMFKEFIIELNYFIHQILGILVSITRLNEVTRKKQKMFHENSTSISSYEAHHKLKMYMALIGYPATIFGIIYSYIEFKIPAILLTSMTIIVTLTALVAYTRYWKPCPIDHSDLKNLSIDLLREKIPIYPRRDILKKIETAFQSKKGVILVGPPGAGKTWIVRSFVEQATDGKICSFIKNFQVFSCNGSILNSGFPSPLISITESFNNHSNQVGFFIDEIHSIFKKNQKNSNGADEQIKTFCENFPYVIGATTSEEYKEHIKNQPAIRNRRFKIIYIDPMDLVKIKTSLFQYLGVVNSKIAFDPELIDYIIEKAPVFNSQTSTVDAAHSLLECAIQKMNSVVQEALEDRIANLQEQAGVIEQQLINEKASHNLLKMNRLMEQLQQLRDKIVVETTELTQKNLRTKIMQKMENYYAKLKRESYSLAVPGCDLAKDPYLSRKWLELHTKINTVTECIAKERDYLGLPRYLDKGLIDTILKEREEDEKNL